MIIRALTKDELTQRQQIQMRVNELQAAGICPTCKNLETGEVYPPADDLIFYEDDLSMCLLETYPRNPGHTIIIVRPHYEDISQLPPDVGAKVFTVILAAIAALKSVLNAEKIYLCTMCDGQRNHLHFQLIPRFAGDDIIGSRVFVKERGILTDYKADIERLRLQMSQIAKG